ncbi:dynein axonemal heavy chain 3-like isoform X3 [Vespa velutina]|uniref:dynein axonemal heavy chain 3-like isoform X3 n=1 Tax=Vespa velutina TaxID=202808 RepID=UPI001FB546C0|nr:dynein axonemal heavy chain 3-like isoform X3 [Vespa velutina]
MTDKRFVCNNTFPTISWIPVVEDCVNSATEITKVLEYAKYPKLLKDQLWTKAVPYKYWSTYTKPSEGIGSIYTPTSAQYRVNTLTKKKKPLDCLPFGVKNKLRMPPREYIELYKEERRRKITRKFKQERNILSKNIINLKDLADGSWSRRKAEKEANQNIENKELLKEQKNKLKKNIPGKEILRNNEVEMPRSIEDQLEELMIRVEEEQNRKIRDEDIERLLYLRNECIADHHLEPYNYDNIENAKKFIIGRLRKCEDFNGIIKKLEGEIIDDYKKSLCYSIVNYILLDADERKRLLIETMPIEYPVLVIRAPVPWHQYKILAEHFMEHNLFITNEILKDIRDLWFSKYYNIMILQIQDLGTFPVAATEIESKINELCNNAVNILTKKWLADVADIFFKKKYAWSGLFEKELHASTSLIEKYFRAVNSLLSRQLRIMVLKTIQHLRNFFMQYRTGNYYEGDYEDMMFIKPPFITVNVEVEVGTMSVCCKPSILDIHTIISRCFNKILNVAMVLPKIEVILFPELDQKGFLFSISRYEDEVLMLITDTLDTISAHIPGPREYLKCYDDLLYIIDGRAKKNLDDFFNIQPFPVLREFEQKIVSYDNLSKEISMFRYKIPLNMIEIDCTIVNDIMRQILHELRTKICDFFADELRLNNRELCSIFDEIAENISKMPETTQEVVELYNYLCESRDTTMFNLKTRLARSTELTLFLFNYQPLTDEDIQLNSRTITWPKEMENIMDLATTRLNMRKEFLESVLRTRRDNFEKKINTMQIAIERFKRKDPPVLTMEEMERATEEVEQLSKDMADIRKEAEEINEEETLLEIELSPYMTIPAMSSIMDVFNKLWHIALNFYKNYEKWFYGSFVGLDADEIREEVDEIWRTLYKLSRVLSDIPGARRVAEMVRAKVEKFQQFIPVLQTICTPGLEARHWEQISEIVKVPIEISDTSCLFDMIEYGLSIHIEKLEEISSAATKEHALLKNLQKMKSEWAEIYFELTLYRDTGVNILTAIDDIQMLLDDHILTAQTMRGSVFVKAFERDMQAWEEKLIMMQDIIDQWLTCQATWMYLEPIFSSEDIMRQMPTEAKNFRRIDKIWRNIMTYVTNNTRVIDATTKPNMLQEFMLCNTLLEEIQKGLNDYLEKKRLFFPRFFFLSNDELLEILSETKDPQRVQPHLKKCFEGINKLRFTKEEDIIGMLSSEEEYVPFSGKIYPADAKGMVERWLCQVEELMIASLRDIAEQSLISYFETVREEWILSWPGQIIICCNQIHWTNEVCESFEDESTTDYLKKCGYQIEKTVALVRGKLDPGARVTLNVLIVIDVHARDVVNLLIEENVRDVMDFKWISQLRYYWIDNSITVAMITTELQYAFEYLGNTPRLVITPLTDRCYRTLMGALKLNLGGSPEGPAGTGKTESAKDLAKAVAKQCVVFNCSDGLDYKAMGKFFKGIAQSGAWACFDEFNRIELEVLSVIAQQILSIQMAISMEMEKFIFEGTEIKLNPSCYIMITMNPGYAGRQELPDNLKVLFRTVAMMVPDYIMIGEITLYSYGFTNAKNLAEKIVHTYKLCSEQLSSQNHYDYGMRAVKTVLIAAGNLKLKHPTRDESVIVLRAIVDVNLPKFLAQDVPLFEGIYSDLFPGVVLSQPDRGELIDLLQINLKKRNLQPTSWYIEKIIQIYEIILVRHGLMIVGSALGGKTQAYQTLAESLGNLAGIRRATMKEFRTIYRIINPKAISLNQLYGSFDPISHEWSDGVLANTFREFALSMSVERKWIVFDGPVDAVWIESMNTVLDDNKKLCLMSGEIIQMSKKMNIIFEPADLEHASPATVSRCGMIYMEPSQLGWISFFESYKKYLKEKLLVEQFELIVEIIEWLIEPVLTFIKYNCMTFIDTSELHMFLSLTRLLTTMLEEEIQVSTVWLQCVLLFCIIWGICSTLTGDSRKIFDVYFRKLLLGNIDKYPRPKAFKLTKQQLFPDRDTVYDWVYDKRNNGCWISWMDTIAQAPLPAHAKASNLIIQTTQVSMQYFFIKNFLYKNIPILFVGPTGTGKSAIILNYLKELPREQYIENIINFSARTSASQTQEIVISKLDRRRKGVYGPAMGKKCVLFVDNLSMPLKETYGAQLPIELLRQFIDHGYWFDVKELSILYLVDILLIAAMLPPGGGSNVVTHRLTRHMHIIGIEFFEEATLSKIFTSIFEWHFAKGFIPEVSRLGKMIVNATMDIFLTAIERFLPTPAKSHYTFNLRDFSRVVEGILLVPGEKLKDPDKLIRLWIHEVYRVFHDRLIDDDDREMLFTMVKHTCYEHLRQPLEKVLSSFLKEDEKAIKSAHIHDLFFGNYMEPDTDPKIYDEVTNLEDLQEKMEYYLKEYNMTSRTPMSLIFFRFAIEHISRISRVLLQDNGHALLVGIGGSGRNSCTKLATSMCEYILYQVEMSRTYGNTEWREDLKQLLLRIGCDGKPTVFLFGDNQIKDETFVEDINILLNTGDVPNLYGTEEMAEILEKMMSVARGMGGRKIETTPMMLYNLFIERIKKNLHIVLTMSPIGDAFRNRIRMFPSLINCCTIDWYTLWPEDALEKVARTSLQNLNIGSELREKCVHICKEFHTSVFVASEDYYKNHHRRYYVTPTSFLQLIASLYRLYGEKINQITKQQNRYITGLEKLDFAAGQVAVMQEELRTLQPKLVAQSQLSDKLMIRIEQDTINVEARKEIVAADEALANEAAAAAQAIKDDCESDLAEATPALEAALSALNTLKPADITIVKSMKSPPAGVKLVMEAVCVLKGVKPDRVQDPKTGKTVEDYWLASIRMLSDMKFLDSLKNFDKDNIPSAYMKIIREKFINDRSFQPEAIKKVSTACEGLCKWVRAMEVYDRVIKVVAPKRAMLAEAEAELAAQMEMLNAKRALLQEVTQKLQSLNDEFAECMREKKKLEDQIDYCTQKLDRAEKLLGGLSGEKSRWSETAVALGTNLQSVIGDVLLSSGVVAYLGAFTVEYRNDLIAQWHASCTRENIPCGKHFSLIDILGEPVKIRSWTIYGLPADNFSIENGIIVKNADRWPLMIDPQNQANKWVKNMEKENKLTVIKLTDPNYVKVVETALQFGTPVLLENILEDIDAILEPVLLKNIYKQRGVLYIKFGENVLEYNSNFRFYITTRLRNPHYLPDVVVKVTLLNFMITPQGLQDQLLGIVVAQELPVLEEKKNQLIVEGANNRRILKEIEDKILEVLSMSEGNILEDETAIKILSTSKVLSEDIETKQDVAAKTAVEIDQARDGYKPVSKHGSVLFFCISELGNVDPMYQYSLSWFIHLYIMSITNSEQSNSLNIRIKYLNSHFTASIYRNICRSLFEKHKLMFSLILCVGLMRAEEKLNEDLWAFLLTGGVALDNPYPNPVPSWLSDKCWSEVVQASTLSGMKKLRISLEQNISMWKECYDSSNPQKQTLPAPFEQLEGWNLEKLIIIRCIRPDKIVAAVQIFIIENMDQSFVEPPPFDLQGSYNDSSNVTPLIFILSPGSDPMAGLIKFAEDNGLSKQDLMTISLGQGQGPIATNMIEESIKSGKWVILQNCHLAISWMKELDRICDEIIVPENTHLKFRLWLTSYPSDEFPVSILQNGVKMTNEPPKGLKNNLLRSYLNDPISDMKFFHSSSKIFEWRSLLFSLCFFHAVVQERRNFGPLGWNIPYEFNESDLRISILQLQLFLNDYDNIPFEALLYLTGECNYGGRVTDDKDRRLLNSLLKNFYNPEVVTNRKYSFSPSGIYHLPEDTDYEGCIEYIRNLPINQTPEVYGLHDNADISKDNQESMQLLSDVLLTQPQISGVGVERDLDETVYNLAADILSKVPSQFNMVYVTEKYPVLYINSMNTVLRQELIKFNQLTNVIKSTLANIQKAIKGQVVMSSELEEIFISMSIGKVPSAWNRKSYSSLKPLGSYINDLLARIEFLQDWIDNDAPVVFWISGFFFTQSFLTGVLQNYARKYKIPIDLIEFDFEVTKFETTIDSSPPLGVYIRGLFLEGSRWNRETASLDESKPKIMFDPLPIIWLKPKLKSELQFSSVYFCPIYKTSARRGILATTGHSSNFVMFILLPTLIDESHWINRGVASLCQLDD